jgi:hypothetical protein
MPKKKPSPKLPVKKPKKTQKKASEPIKVTVSTDKYDNRDKPKKLKKEKIISEVKSLLRESAKKEKQIKLQREKDRASKKVTPNGALLNRALKIANDKKKDSKPTGKKSGRKKKAPAPYKYYNPYLDKIPEYHKKRVKEKDVNELKRFKKNLQNRKYDLNSKLSTNRSKKNKKKKFTKTEINKLHKKALHLSVAIREINKKLGIGRELNELPSKKTQTTKEHLKVKKGRKLVEVEKVIKREILPVWEGREKLTELLKTNLFLAYVINGNSYGKNQQPDIFIEYSDLEDRAYEVGVSTPHVIFYQRITDKVCEITEYNY